MLSGNPKIGNLPTSVAEMDSKGILVVLKFERCLLSKAGLTVDEGKMKLVTYYTIRYMWDLVGNYTQ